MRKRCHRQSAWALHVGYAGTKWFSAPEENVHLKLSTPSKLAINFDVSTRRLEAEQSELSLVASVSLFFSVSLWLLKAYRAHLRTFTIESSGKERFYD